MMKESNVGFVFFTSGSTGEPKTVNKTSKCVVKESQDLAEIFNKIVELNRQASKADLSTLKKAISDKRVRVVINKKQTDK